MKVLHVSCGYFPDQIGGTEVYVRALARGLWTRGVESVVVAPGSETVSYVHDGVRVYRFRGASRPSRQVQESGDPEAVASIEAVLRSEAPDIVHMHAMTGTASHPHLGAVGRLCARVATSRAIGLVVTYHTPAMTCERGSLMRWGTAPCTGLMDAVDCTACALHGLGLPHPASVLTARLPREVSALFGASKAGNITTVLGMRHSLARRHASIRAAFDAADAIVVLSEWGRRVLVTNGVPAHKLTMSRQALMDVPAAALRPQGGGEAASPLPAGSWESRPIRLAYIGRLEESKGLHVVLRALQAGPPGGITLDIFGPPGSQSYRRRLERAISPPYGPKMGGNTGIRRCGPLPHSSVIPTLRGYHALVVPSQTLETGPLVVLEAFAAGIPVLGSDVGGISELVTNGVNGYLVPPHDHRAWRSLLTSIVRNPHRLDSLKLGIPDVRAEEEVVDEMCTVYGRVLAMRDRRVDGVPAEAIRTHSRRPTSMQRSGLS